MEASRTTISVLIPCYNEELSIRKAVQACLFQTRKPDQIVVVNDGSTDRSAEILREFGERVMVVHTGTNTGNKSYAQEYGLQFVTGEILIMADADTILDARFVERMEETMRNPSVAAVSGYVRGLRHNWLTACREIEYVFCQVFYKVAQSYLNTLIVIPGCAAAFRTETFRRDIRFTHDTVTEDLDFTYQLHRKGHRIAYDRRAIVYTQDPADLRSYITQIRRWYRGGWQNLRKHSWHMLHLPKHTLELGLIYGESLFFVLLLMITPFVNMQLFTLLIVAQFWFVIGIGLLAAVLSRRLDLLLYSPLYVCLLTLNNVIYLHEFFNEIVFRRNNLAWGHSGRRRITL